MDAAPPAYGATQPPPAYPQQPGYVTKQPGASPYPQQPMYQPAPGQTTTVIQQPATIIVAHNQFFENPVSMNCPYCQATIVTATQYEPGTLTWLACGGTALVGCWLGCCLIPFCVDALKDVIHSCPNCKQQLGVYRRM